MKSTAYHPSFRYIAVELKTKKNKQKKTTLHFYFQKAFLTRLMGLSPCNLVNAGCEGINSLNFHPVDFKRERILRSIDEKYSEPSAFFG